MGNKHRGRTFWTELVSAYENSSLSQRAFQSGLDPRAANPALIGLLEKV